MTLHTPTAEGREGRLRAATAGLYGGTVGTSDVMTPDAVRDFWRDEFRTRLRSDQDCVVLDWGEPGSGKSTAAIDLCRLVDDTFTPETLPDRVAFRPAHVARLYEATPRYGAAWVDEAGAAGLLSTDTHTADQADLVELINLIRAKNILLVVIMPDPSDLAKSFRARRADYRIECEPIPNRGTAHIGRRAKGRKFFRDDDRWLGFMDDTVADPYAFTEYQDSPDASLRAYWAAYEPLKYEFLGRRVTEIREDMERRDELRGGRQRSRGVR